MEFDRILFQNFDAHSSSLSIEVRSSSLRRIYVNQIGFVSRSLSTFLSDSSKAVCEIFFLISHDVFIRSSSCSSPSKFESLW